MDKNTDPQRDRPSEKGRKNDPFLRDETAAPPGTNTISPSKTDEANENVTHSAMDGKKLTEFDVDRKADPSFDQPRTDE